MLDWRLRRRLWRGTLCLLASGIAGTSALDHAGVFGYAGDDWHRFDRQRVQIVAAVQSDVLQVNQNGSLQQVQLAGLYGPRGEDHFADWARQYTQGRVAGKPAILRLEPLQTRDRSGRLLAHVYLLDTDNLNADMVKDGMAYADRRARHSMKGHYEQLENEARKKKYGLWKGLTDAEMPEWRRMWLAEKTARKDSAR